MPCSKENNIYPNITHESNINNGMMTKVWGPAGWLFLHCVAFGYPYKLNPEDKEDQQKMKHYKNFFESIATILPCRYCRESYQDFIDDYPIDPYLTSRKDLSKWFYTIHNKINHKLGVPECELPTFEEVSHNYELYRAKCKKTTKKERHNNAAKGCIRPANGTPKRCIVKVVSCDNGDITRRTNSDNDADDVTKYNFPSQSEYIVIHKTHIVYPTLLILVVCLFLSYTLYNNRKNIKF